MFGIRSIRVLLALVLTTVVPGTVHAQCLDWRAFPASNTLTASGVGTAVTYDVGFGPELIVCGSLLSPQPPHSARRFLGWDGTQFHDLPAAFTALNGGISKLFVYDDGSGSALYAIGGGLTVNGNYLGGIARWNGTAWSTFGQGIEGGSGLRCSTIFDDGSGPALYVGGAFFFAGGAPGNRLARWNGTSWSSVPTITGGGAIVSLTGFDDGSGMKLFVAMGSSSGAGVNAVGRLDPGGWTNLGGMAGFVTSMTVFDDGNGPGLYFAGSIISSNYLVVRWNGASFQPVGNQLGAAARELFSLDTGAGPKLYATLYTTVDPVRVWDGVSWSTLPSYPPAFPDDPSYPDFMTTFDTGFGPKLVAMGTPHPVFGAGGLFGHGCDIATWTGTAWQPFEKHTGFSGEVRCLEVLDLGAGPQLFAAGSFAGAGVASTEGIAIRNGSDWVRAKQDVGSAPVTALGTLHGPTNTYLCAARKVVSPTPAIPTVTVMPATGQAWLLLQTGSSADTIHALQEFNNELFIAGEFIHLNGINTPNIGRWNGTDVLGMTAWMNGAVRALTVYDDGTGPALYAAGNFTVAGGVPANRIARWNGSTWAPLAGGFDAMCDTLVAFDDGTGPALFAAGTFTTAGGAPATRVGKWQNGAWSALGAGLDAQVSKLATFDDGSGLALYACGDFTASGATPIPRIARWNGTSWTSVGAAVDGSVYALKSFDDGSGPQLFAGGAFHNVGSQRSDYLSSWRGCSGSISTYCAGDGTIAACPCGNQGLFARGCDNSFGTGGAHMSANGTTNPDTIAIHVAGLIPGTASMLFQGSSAFSTPLPFADGLLCAGGNIRRLQLAFSSGGALDFPTAGAPSISAQSAAAGDPIVPGVVRSYQAWYRDANVSFCSPATSNVSSAVRIAW